MKRRSGFTLVELMVAMALIMFIMAILSEAFVAGLKTFRDLKAVSDMAERLRAASTTMRRELAANHFDGQRRLSQADFWQSEGPGLISPPREGFIHVFQGSAPTFAPTATGVGYFREGSDSSEVGGAAATVDQRLLNSYRATDHMLHFTVKLRGNERGDFFAAGNVPAAGTVLTTSPLFRGSLHYQEVGGIYSAQWAEVVYFLRQLPETAHGTPLFALMRRQRLLVPDNGLLLAPVVGNSTAPYPELSCNVPPPGGTQMYFNSPRDLTMPIHRLNMNPANLNPPTNLAGLLIAKDPLTGALSYPTMFEETGLVDYQGADVMLSDVVSFEVRVLPIINGAVGTRFVSLFDTSLNGLIGFNNSWNGVNQPRVFDTWSNMVETTLDAKGNRIPLIDYSTWNPASAPNPASNIPIPFSTNLRLGAVQVIIRVWDVKTDQTREITIAQDL